MAEVEKVGRNIARIVIPYPKQVTWNYKVLCISDIHYDSIKCRRDILKLHLDRAIEEKAGILIVGDLYDAMQGKYDPRNAKYELRPEYKTDRYLDDIVEDCAEFLRPYAQNIFMIADGNHETSIKNRYETDLIQRTIALMTTGTKNKILYGGYAGWVKFIFRKYRETKAQSSAVTINYHHGSGLKSKAAQDRRACAHPDADILLYGHWHEHWSRYNSRQRLTREGNKLYKDLQLHLGIPGYKDDIADGASGWAVEKGHTPKPVGGWWLNFKFSKKHGRVVFQPIATT